jgi:hypothetical protein
MPPKCKGKGEAVPACNYVPRHEDVYGNGGTAPRILNLGNGWKTVWTQERRENNPFPATAGDRTPIVQPATHSLY